MHPVSVEKCRAPVTKAFDELRRFVAHYVEPHMSDFERERTHNYISYAQDRCDTALSLIECCPSCDCRGKSCGPIGDCNDEWHYDNWGGL